MPTEPPPTQQLIDTAAELVGTVHDYGPDAIADLLDPLSIGHLYQLTITLAAMVDPDRSPTELLAWLEQPIKSREFTPTYMQLAGVAPGRRGERRTEVARLTDLGISIPEIARRLGISPRSVGRHRAALRAHDQQAA